MRPTLLRAAAIAAALLLTPTSIAHEFKIAAIEIEHPFLRATPPNASIGAG